MKAISLVESVQPFRTDQFDSTCQSNQLTLIAMNFFEKSLLRAGRLLAEQNCIGIFVMEVSSTAFYTDF